MNELQVKRVYEIFGLSEALVKKIHLAPDPQKQDSWTGSIALHYSSPFMAELMKMEGLEVFETGRCGARHPDGHICALSEAEDHRIHADGAQTWPNDEYGIDRVKVRMEKEMRKNEARLQAAHGKKPPITLDAEVVPVKDTRVPKALAPATAKPALVRIEPPAPAPEPVVPPQRNVEEPTPPPAKDPEPAHEPPAKGGKKS